MSEQVAVIIVISILITGLCGTVIHSHELGGNWETREHSAGIGCRFPARPK